MAIRVACGSCGKQLNAPDNFAGKQVRCPGCKSAVLVTAATLPLNETSDFLPQSTPPEPEPAKSSLVACEDCGHAISPDAIACPHCGRADSPPSDAGKFFLETSIIGKVLSAIGFVGCFYFGLLFDTSIATDSSNGILPGRVMNFSLMSAQQLGFAFSLGLMLFGRVPTYASPMEPRSRG